MQFGKSKHIDRRGGFTLLELLMSAAIMAIVIASCYVAASSSLTSVNCSRQELRATQIIMSRIEALHLEAWGNGTNQPSQLFNTNLVPRSFSDYYYPLGMDNIVSNRGTRYYGTVTVSTNAADLFNATYNNSLAKITISLTWTDGVGGLRISHARSASTLISKYGIQNYVYTH